jgi:hypothetical protein
VGLSRAARPWREIAVPFALGGGFGLVLALAIRDQVSEALAAVLVLLLSVFHARFDSHLRILAVELARNLDDSLPNLVAMRAGFADSVAGRLGRGEPLFFAHCPDEDISLKIFGPMIPSSELGLAARVMACFDAAASAGDLLGPLESEASRGLSAARRADWLLMTEAVLDAAIGAGAAARGRLAELYGLRPAGAAELALAAGGAAARPKAARLIGQMISQASTAGDMGAPETERQGKRGPAA